MPYVQGSGPADLTRMKQPQPGITARCFVTRVVDGDTLDVEVRINTRIRLLDCWAPELHGGTEYLKELGVKARDNLVDLCTGGYGVVNIPTEQAHSTTDLLTFDRLLGRVWMEGQADDLSSQQVLAGVASSGKGKRLGE